MNFYPCGDTGPGDPLCVCCFPGCNEWANRNGGCKKAHERKILQKPGPWTIHSAYYAPMHGSKVWEYPQPWLPDKGQYLRTEVTTWEDAREEGGFKRLYVWRIYSMPESYGWYSGTNYSGGKVLIAMGPVHPKSKKIPVKETEEANEIVRGDQWGGKRRNGGGPAPRIARPPQRKE